MTRSSSPAITVLWTLCVIINVPLISYGREQVPKYDLWSDYDTFKREHSLSQPYWGHGWMIPNWDFLGNTVVTNDQVRLTSDVKSQSGALWNSVPVDMLDWEVFLHFKIHGRGTTLAGDGLAFWYVKDRMETGPVFGSKDFFMGLGVMVDTYGNQNLEHEYPYISIMVNNGSLHYDHDGDGTLTQIGGCQATNLRNPNYDTVIMIRYENDVLKVMTDFDGSDFWTVCAVIDGVKLPTKYYFGLTAATGDLSDNHDIISIHSNEIGTADGDGDRQKEFATRPFIIPSVVPSLDPTPDQIDEKQTHNESRPEWSWMGLNFWYLGYIVLIGLVGVVGVKGYHHYRRQSKKRFY